MFKSRREGEWGFTPLTIMSENKGKVVQRQDVAENFKWKTEDIYANLEAWQADFQKAKAGVQEVESYQGRLGESAITLLECLKKVNELSEIFERLFSYASRKKDEDTRIAGNQSLYNRILSLATEMESASSYMTPEILGLPEELLNKFMKSNSELALYAHYLDNITRIKEHVLSPELEKVVAMASEMGRTPYQVHSMLDDADIKYPSVQDEEGNEVQLTKGRYFKLLQSKDRRVRKEAFEKFYSPYENHKNTFATALDANIKADMFNAKVRNYNSTLEASLNTDHIPVSVYKNLIKAVTENLEPMYKYVRLRKKVLEVDELHMYDVYLSIIKDVDEDIPYDRAKKTIVESLAPLGKEYQELIQKGFDSRWVDVYENEGKASGAYSAGCYGVHPFVLMNYNDTIDSMYTLTHEMGHALHSYYSNKEQSFTYHSYPIFLAEVASTLNENLLTEYLLKTTEDKGLKMAILNHFLEQFRGTVYRQTMFAEYEMLIHEKAEAGEPLNHETLSKLYRELNEKYYGPNMIIDPQIDIEWARIPHFYYNFYVYKYATGFSAATSLSRQILEEGQPAVDRYLKFLSAGGSDYPINILKEAGVDMTSPEPIIQALQTFAEKVDELEKLLCE